MGFWSRLGEELSKAGNAIAGGASAAWGGVSAAGSWVGDKAGVAWDATVDVVTNPVESAQAVGGFLWWTVSSPTESIPLFAQGVANAAASTAGIVVDAVANGGALLINSASNIPGAIYNTAASITNPVMRVVGLEDYQAGYAPLVRPVPYIGFYATTGLTSAANFGVVDWLEERQGTPLNGYQKTMLFGSQAVAEIPAFMAAAAFTGGTGGAMYLAAKGSVMAGRAAYTARTATQAFRTAALVENAAAPAVTRAALSDAFKSGARAGWNWSDPRYGTFNRVAEAAGAGVSFWATSSEYSTRVEEGDAILNDVLGEGGDRERPEGWTDLDTMFAEAAEKAQQVAHSMPYSREGSRLAGLQREAAGQDASPASADPDISAELTAEPDPTPGQ